MHRLIIVTACLLFAVTAHATGGLITKQSLHGVTATIDRLQGALEEKGLTIFARVDHSAGAARVDKVLRPTELLIFGNPKAGTPIMQANQLAGIDLPMKALAWEDAEGNVWLTYNDPSYITHRHDISGLEELVGKMQSLLNAMTDKAVE